MGPVSGDRNAEMKISSLCFQNVYHAFDEMDPRMNKDSFVHSGTYVLSAYHVLPRHSAPRIGEHTAIIKAALVPAPSLVL